MKNLLFTTLSGLAITVSLTAQTMINVDLGAGTSVGSGTAGVVASNGWQLKSGFPDFADLSLNYADGSASGATVGSNSSGTGNIDVIGAATTDGNYSMFNRGLGIGYKTGGNGIADVGTAITVAGLDTAGVFANGYDVYVYIASASNFSGTDIVDTFGVGNGTIDYFLEADETQASYQGSYIQATATAVGSSVLGNYVKFSGMTGASFTINAYNVDHTTDSAAALTGMQIVAVPEPSAYALIAGMLAMMHLMVRRRRS
jgi:hypothetical protein